MSWWDRLRGKGRSQPEDHESTAPEPKAAPTSDAEPATPSPLEAARRTLEIMAADASAVHPEAAHEAFSKLVAAGQAADALAMARAALGHGTAAPALRLEVAELLSMRGDDERALGHLRRLLDVAQPSLAALSLAAEIHERRGEDGEALVRSQQILSIDMNYPRAKARVSRLIRKQGEGQPQGAGGATIVTEGALARGRYQVETELGRGGAGTVFFARDTQLDRRVALKVYHQRGVVERERLLVEARVPARLEHPGIVRVFDLDDALGAIAMEWVRGGAVRAEMTRLEGRDVLRRVTRWWDTAAEALSAVHADGYAHRDIKPSNFLLRDDDRVVLTDFGLAMPLGTRPASGRGEGTLQYMAPEQASGAPASAAMDVHALGKSFAEVLDVLPAKDRPDALLSLAAACARKEPKSRPSLADVRLELRRFT